MQPLNDAYKQQILTAGDGVALALARAQAANVGDELFDLLVEWAAWIRINKNQAVNTAENYVANVTRWLCYLRDSGQSVESAGFYDVDQWQKSLAMDGAASATRGLALTAVRRFYKFWMLRSLPLPGGDPTLGHETPKKTDRAPRKFSDAQLSAILCSCDRSQVMGQRDFAVLAFLLNTGARLHEVVGLTLNQLAMNKKTGVVRILGKGAKERVISFEGEVVDALWEWLTARGKVALPGEQALFVALSGKGKGQRLGRSGVNDVLNRALKKGGLKKQADDPFGVHRMRSCYASKMYDTTKDIRRVQKLLGHKDINTTEKYIVISDTHLSTRMPGDYTAGLIGKGEPVPRYVQTKLANRQGVE